MRLNALSAGVETPTMCFSGVIHSIFHQACNSVLKATHYSPLFHRKKATSPKGSAEGTQVHFSESAPGEDNRSLAGEGFSESAGPSYPLICEPQASGTSISRDCESIYVSATRLKRGRSPGWNWGNIGAGTEYPQ